MSRANRSNELPAEDKGPARGITLRAQHRLELLQDQLLRAAQAAAARLFLELLPLFREKT